MFGNLCKRSPIEMIMLFLTTELIFGLSNKSRIGWIFLSQYEGLRHMNLQ